MTTIDLVATLRGSQSAIQAYTIIVDSQATILAAQERPSALDSFS
jgi:hypothetical protein